MANAGGGLIVVGIKDANDAAAEITPVPLGSEVTRLRQMVISRIEPYLSFFMHEVPIEGGPNGCIILAIPPSSRRPFAVSEGIRLGYFRRTGRNTVSLTEAEVAMMYQIRSRRLRDTRARHDLLSRRVEQVMKSSKHPVIYISITPLEQYDRVFQPNYHQIRSVQSIGRNPVFGQTVGEILFSHVTPGFKSLEFRRFDKALDNQLLRKREWLEFHDDGSFLGVILGTESKGQDMAHFYDTRVTCELIARLSAYGTLASHFGLYGEIAILVGIAKSGLPATIRMPPARAGGTIMAVDSPVATQLSAEIADLRTPGSVVKIALPLVDDLMSAFGLSAGLLLRRDGSIVIGNWGSWKSRLRSWAKDNGIPVA